MHKVNFLEVYDRDSATEEVCSVLSEQYRRAAQLVLHESGFLVAAMRSNNPEIQLSWHFRALDGSHNAEGYVVIAERATT